MSWRDDQATVRRRDHLVDRIVEQPGQQLRSFEEGQRIARRWGVDDDEIPVTAAVQLRQLLDRHVVLRARQGSRHVAVEPVAEDAVGLFAEGDVLADYSAAIKAIGAGRRAAASTVWAWT